MRLLKYFLAFALIVIVSLSGTYYYFTRGLPSLANLEGYHPNLVTNVYSDDGRLIGEFYIERRVVVSLNKMPPYLIKAFLAAEDAQFYEHEGISYISIFRAFVKNIRAGKVVQGGSTITQQLAKSFLTNERKLARKVREAIMAYRIERQLNKDEILSLYLNQIYFGNGAYGVQTAAESYFGKNVEGLDLAEAAMLAGLPKAPSKYSPRANFDLAKTRRQVDMYKFSGSSFNDPQSVTTTSVFKLIVQEEGWRGLTIGWLPRLTKIAPACAIMISSYEFAKMYFAKHPGLLR